MHVIVIHSISDPDAFWGIQLDLPAGTINPTVAPNNDGTRAVCIWETDSVETVRNLIEGAAGQISSNEYFAVDDGKAQGMPA
jgi:hypothetical protein